MRSLAFALFLAAIACGAEPPAPAPPPAAAPAATGHTHAAPHGGVLVELGEEFGHIELVLTAYVLDGEAEQPVRLTQPAIGVKLAGVMATEPGGLSARPFELAARANVLTGETVGDTSQFMLTHDAFKGLTSFRGLITHVAYKGQDFRDVVVTYPAK
jgi:hypothetical protein